MAAYVIYNMTQLLDETAMGEYVQKFDAMFGKYDGKVIAVAPDFDVLEGECNAQRVVIIEFSDMQALKRWYDADEYQPLIKLRQTAAQGDMIALNGLG
ncbi:MAG: DUF1330 domain-containing protein [Rhodospirillaceae bacterium]|jgi:uncharacterized protein (DUF1330 family)|nr:DUF1330 domain-containing protein [Rhodospirillaceae bacterium]MBT4044237.1 DUF1330 domain-containing protein [Rhodospirillaceae bacterium]MBT4688805.1 DUF1330 domain-containing protein [Rhodospirillaceae bacterium]MBT5083369.1 DUF1330 domain-containing protein [Rhodospirillaceae bacterium]MBT5525582.1 DUF1330 domain-containing protein [Rhodospirillaceae bacterium]